MNERDERDEEGGEMDERDEEGGREGGEME